MGYDDKNIYKDREPEVPEFIIERDDEGMETSEVPEGVLALLRRKKWLRRLLKAIAVVLLVALTLWAYEAWNYYVNIGVPVSTKPSENIAKLQMPPVEEKARVVHTSDSVLGVDLDFYAIYGLRANIEFEELTQPMPTFIFIAALPTIRKTLPIWGRSSSMARRDSVTATALAMWQWWATVWSSVSRAARK